MLPETDKKVLSEVEHYFASIPPLKDGADEQNDERLYAVRGKKEKKTRT